MARRAQDLHSVLVSLYDLGLSSQAQGDLADAAGHLKEGLALAAKAGDDTSAAYYLAGLAAIAGQQDDPERAARLLAAARSLLRLHCGTMPAGRPPHVSEVIPLPASGLHCGSNITKEHSRRPGKDRSGSQAVNTPQRPVTGRCSGAQEQHCAPERATARGRERWRGIKAQPGMQRRPGRGQ